MKNAIVTGASRGLGKAIAEMLAKEGYGLYLICQNNIDTLSEYGKDLANIYGVPVQCFKGNVSDSGFVDSLFNEIVDLDVLINNAGISYVGLLQDMTDDEWHNITAVNLDSVFYFSRQAIKLMLKKHSGNIINISSVWGNVGASCEVAYSATKGGVNAFTKALAKELAPSGISVNAISCGMMDTDMNGHLSPEDKEEIVAQIPAGRQGTGDDVAMMVKSIINAPSYMTGQIISLDGGWI